MLFQEKLFQRGHMLREGLAMEQLQHGDRGLDVNRLRSLIGPAELVSVPMQIAQLLLAPLRCCVYLLQLLAELGR